VPVLAARLFAGHEAPREGAGSFERVERAYARLVAWLVTRRGPVIALYAAGCAAALSAAPRLGTELFPRVDAGQMQLRIRAPSGTRLERTEAIVRDVEQAIRDDVGPGAVRMTLANIGSPPWSYPVNALYVFNQGPHEAVLLVALERGAKRPPLPVIEERLRAKLAARFPSVRFSFEPGDIVSQVLDFGAAAPIHVTVSGRDLAADEAFARRVQQALAGVPTLRDAQIPAALDYPTLDVHIDRERAGELGLSASLVVRGMLNAASSSVLTTPIFWTDPSSGVPYRVAVRVPENQITSAEDLLRLPVMKDGASSTLLRDVADVRSGVTPGAIDRINGQRTVSVTANVSGADLGRAADEVDRAIASLGEPPRGVTVALHGRAELMRETLASLRGGLLFSVLVIFLLLAANFQSAREPLMVLLLSPAVLSGVVLALLVTGTTLNVQSLMGAIMAIGVSVANGVLLVSRAKDLRRNDEDRAQIAILAARGRLRAILMTTLAMVAGMLPTALGLGEGGEQSAPLGRAVVGGLLASTSATLLVLPALYASLAPRVAREISLHPDDDVRRAAPSSDSSPASDLLPEVSP
jgi:multidrug efflux pump subunit AcrB